MSRSECWWCEMSLGGELCPDMRETGKCPAEEYYDEIQEPADEEPYLGDWLPPEWRNPDLLAYLVAQEGRGVSRGPDERPFPDGGT